MDYILKVEPCIIHITPFGFYQFALDYNKAAKAVSKIDFQKRINYPAYFLYCRSIELTIKAVLLASKNFSKKEIHTHDFCKLLPKLGHHLEKVLLLKDVYKNMIFDLDKWYKTDQKRFEYFSLETGIPCFIESNKDFPSYQHLKSEYLRNKGLIPCYS